MRDSSVSYASAAAKVDAWSCVIYGNEEDPVNLIVSIGFALTSNIMQFTCS